MNGRVRDYAPPLAVLDGRQVPKINSRLRAGEERADAHVLQRNFPLRYLGTKVYGQGFVLTPDERDSLCENKHNRGRIFPFIGGEEVNSSPNQGHQRYIINFEQLSVERAAEWPDLLKILKERVKPERDLAKSSTADGDHRKRYWWQFSQPRPELYTAIAPLKRCLVNSQVTKHLVFAFQPTDRVFAHTVYVYPLDTYGSFAALQSRVHEPWARLLSSSMKTDLRYAASDCFDTFPFPRTDPREAIPSVEAAGKAFYEARARLMLDTEQGLTKTYNALRDPENVAPAVAELRRLTEAMDRAVLDAYGWTDIPVPPYCPRTDAERAAVQAFEDEVIDRLYVLNAERAREEKRLGLSKVKGKKGKQLAKPAQDLSDDTPTERPDAPPTSKKAAKKAAKAAAERPATKPPKKATAQQAPKAHADLFDNDEK